MSIEVKSFRVMCPMDNTLHDALARVSVTIVGLIVLGTDAGAWFYALLAVLVLHIVRYACMLSFAKRYPKISLEYDKAIRYGYKL